MQWCQRLEVDYGKDSEIWQSLDLQSFHHSSKLCLCNSFHGCFVPNSKEGHSVHTSFFLSFMCLANCILYLGYPRFGANIHLSVSTYCVSSFVIVLPHSLFNPKYCSLSEFPRDTLLFPLLLLKEGEAPRYAASLVH